MGERIIANLVPEHLNTEEGAARFNAAVEQRNQADFQCFQALRDLVESADIYGGSLKAVLLKGCFEKDDETREVMEYQAEQVEEALKARRDADIEFSNALLGRS